MTVSMRVDDRTIEIGNPDKVLFPDIGLTKRELADYYRRVAPTMISHVRGRPMTMRRYPDGIRGDGFYQRDVPAHFPDWIRTVAVPKDEGEVTHVVCDDAATIVYLADQACITPHVFLGTVDDLEHPDRMVFDLDPPDDSDDAAQVRFAARVIADLLGEVGLRSRIMTTGSSGFHVVVPLARAATFDEVRDFAHRCAETATERHPEELTVEQRKDERGGRVFVDYLRNGHAQTTVAPYAVRARSRAPVAIPIDWNELGSTGPRSYTVANVFRRLGQKDDPWSIDGIRPQHLDDRVRTSDLGS